MLYILKLDFNLYPHKESICHVPSSVTATSPECSSCYFLNTPLYMPALPKAIAHVFLCITTSAAGDISHLYRA